MPKPQSKDNKQRLRGTRAADREERRLRLRDLFFTSSAVTEE